MLGPSCLGDFLYVLCPRCDNEYLSLEVKYKKVRSGFEALRNQPGAFPPGSVAWPEANGLIPWAITDNGDTCFWRVVGTPAHWPVVVIDGRAPESETFAMTASEFVYGVLSGALRCRIFPQDWPPKRPRHRPVAV